MTTTTLTRYECDRCGKVKELPLVYRYGSIPTAPTGWVAITVLREGDEGALLLCGACDTDFLTFRQGRPLAARLMPVV